MSNVEDDAPKWEDARNARLVPPEQPVWMKFLTWGVRAIARLWVVSLLLVAGAVAGIALYELNHTTARLDQVREEPGVGPYAVVAYRRELERRIAEVRNSEIASETLPVPPDRPRLLVEIDRLRQQNEALRAAESQARVVRDVRPRRDGPEAPR